MFEPTQQTSCKQGIKTVIVLVVLLAVASTESTFAQAEAMHWKFGERAGLDFTSGVPSPTRSALVHLEGSASYSDSNGNLLFYTDGFQAWQRNDTLMPSIQYQMRDSIGAQPLHSTTQQALIAPSPYNPARFIVFNPGNSTSYFPENTIKNFDWFAEVRYHPSWFEVDMSGNGGMGYTGMQAIDTAGMPEFSEKVTGTLDCDGFGYWIVMRERNGPRFFSYNAEGLNVSYPPVISEAGTYSGSDTSNLGAMKISPDGKWLAMARGWSEPGEVQLFEFNTTDGKVRNGFTLQPVTPNDEYRYYGVAFSDDSKMLYVTAGPNLLQYDLTLPTKEEIAQSGFLVKTEFSVPLGNLGSLQLGPDKKLYVPLVNSEFVGVIHYPRRRFDGCQFDVLGVQLLPGTRAWYGLPNFMDHIFAPEETVQECLSAQAAFLFDDACVGECIEYEDVSVNAPEEWEWAFEGGSPSTWLGQDPPPICYSQPGSYTTTLKVSARGGYDLFTQTVRVYSAPRDLFESDTLYVCEAPAELIAQGADTLRFSTGLPYSDSSVQVFGDEGMVYVHGTTRFGCEGVDSIYVKQHTFDVAASPDVTICPGDSVQIEVLGGSEYFWSPAKAISAVAVANPTVWPTTTTTYSCIVWDDLGCQTTLSVQVEVEQIEHPLLSIAADSVCEGQPLNVELLNANQFTAYEWHFNETVISTSSELNTTATNNGAYELFVSSASGCDLVVAVPVSIVDSVVLHGPESVVICPGEQVEIRVLTNSSELQWLGPNAPSAGTTSATLQPTETVTYTLLASNGICSKTTTFTIVVDEELVAEVSDDVTICLGDTTVLQVTEGDLYEWSPSTGLSSSNSANPLAFPDATTEYTVTVYRGSCVGSTTTTVYVENPPQVVVSTVGTLCPEEVFSLTAQGASTYTWVLSNDTIGTGAVLEYALERSETIMLFANEGTCTVQQAVPVSVVPIDKLQIALPQIEMDIGETTVATIEISGYEPWFPIEDRGVLQFTIGFDARTLHISDTLAATDVKVQGTQGTCVVQLNLQDIGTSDVQIEITRLMATLKHTHLQVLETAIVYDECHTVVFAPEVTAGEIVRSNDCLVYDIQSADPMQTSVHMTAQTIDVAVDGGRGRTSIQVFDIAGRRMLHREESDATKPVRVTASHQLPAGMYLIRIDRGSNQALHRILLIP